MTLLPSDPLSITRINYDRYCYNCRVVTPWWSTIRRFRTFISINCACLNCGRFAGCIMELPDAR